MFTIYLDMDGVLCNFEKEYTKTFGKRPNSVDRDQKEFSANWSTFVFDKHFEKLDWFAGADVLLDFIEKLRKLDPTVNVEILTSTGGQKYDKEVCEQKENWLKAHGITYKANCVPGKKFKGDFGGEWKVLIDDTPKCVEYFNANGGHGIIHKEVVDTLNDLADYYERYKNEYILHR